ELRRLTTHTAAQLREPLEGRVTVGGLVSRLRRTKIRSGPSAGRVMGHFVLEDLTGGLSVVLFADQLQRYESLLGDESIVLVSGSLRERGGECELTAEEIVPLESASRRLIRAFEIRLDPDHPTSDLLRLRDVLAENPGEIPVALCLDLPEGRVAIAPERRFRVASSPGLLREIEQVLGPGRARELGPEADP
ncbi:MAG TPA: OB-fold nucleic acid binding domain-containing protein, partial [Thermoanaerobaculia bacterium]|nr:OB-fold nucleic acid binding domain-containing protein [Thermoanaerobaculia bacterium]